MATCAPDDLIEESKCFLCLTEKQLDMVIAQQLMTWAGLTSTPQELINEAKCLVCLETKQIILNQVQSLCEILASGGGGSGIVCECVTPTMTDLQQTSSVAPFTVSMSWTLPDSACALDTIDIYRSVNGGAFSFWASTDAANTSYSNNANNPAGTEGQTITFKLRYVSGDLTETCDFSNELSVNLTGS